MLTIRLLRGKKKRTVISKGDTKLITTLKALENVFQIRVRFHIFFTEQYPQDHQVKSLLQFLKGSVDHLFYRDQVCTGILKILKNINQGKCKHLLPSHCRALENNYS